MPKRSNGEQKSGALTLLDLKETWFNLNGKQINVEDATDAEFDEFIRHHITIGWTLEERRDAVNLALERGQTLGIHIEETQEKSKNHLIFRGIEDPSQADS